MLFYLVTDFLFSQRWNLRREASLLLSLVSIFLCVCIQVSVHGRVSHGRMSHGWVYLCLCGWRPEEDFRCPTLSLCIISLRKCLSPNWELGLWSVTSKSSQPLISIPSSTAWGFLVCSCELLLCDYYLWSKILLSSKQCLLAESSL